MKNILVGNDSKSLRQLVVFSLSSNGYRTLGAKDGIEGLYLAKRQAFDLVVTDVNMPNMDGIDLVKELRKLDNYQTTPLLILTTESDSSSKAREKKAGVTAWLEKPFNPLQLISTIEDILGN